MPVTGNLSRGELDTTYMLFLIVDGVFLLIALITTLDPKNSEGWGMLLGPTVGVAGFVVLIVAIFRSISRRLHRPLLLLAVSPILVIIVSVASVALGVDDPGNGRILTFFSYVLACIVFVCMALMVLVPVWWFARGRRRYQEPAYES
jgi:hypothetical protein